MIVFSILLTVSVVLSGCDKESSSSRSQNSKRTRNSTSTYRSTTTASTTTTTLPVISTTSTSTTPAHSSSKGVLSGNVSTLYDVTSVVDGDTIKVRIGNAIETLRLIGIDTPEVKDPRKPVQCFGAEASAKMMSLVVSKKVLLENDPSQGERDKYGRLLRYVFLSDGTHVNLAMISGGYAHEYTYRLPYKYQTQFKEAQRQASNSGAGLWSPTTCNGNTTQGVQSPNAQTQSSATTHSSGSVQAPPINSGVVKKSNSNICHAPGTTYYEQTKNFTPFSSLQECLDSGGRLPKR